MKMNFDVTDTIEFLMLIAYEQSGKTIEALFLHNENKSYAFSFPVPFLSRIIGKDAFRSDDKLSKVFVKSMNASDVSNFRYVILDPLEFDALNLDDVILTSDVIF